jgi:hypothetical protein
MYFAASLSRGMCYAYEVRPAAGIVCRTRRKRTGHVARHTFARSLVRGLNTNTSRRRGA